MPLSERWGGWYVTGDDESINHMGNSIAFRPENTSKLKLKKITDDFDLPKYWKQAIIPMQEVILERF